VIGGSCLWSGVHGGYGGGMVFMIREGCLWWLLRVFMVEGEDRESG
jgi:hypothetical protein